MAFIVGVSKGPVRGMKHLVSDELLLDYKYLQSLRFVTRGVTHDYNNIFTGIAGQISLLDQAGDRAEIERDRLAMMTDLVDRGTGRTAILQQCARYTSYAVEPIAQSLRRIIDHVVALLRVCSRIHQFETVLPVRSFHIECRFDELALALFYLGENAVAAMADGGVVSLVASEAPATQAGSMIQVSVYDSGEGVSAAVRDSLFEPFVSGKGTVTTAGLGLYAARVLIRRFGGDVALFDAADGGTEARLTLPCCSAVPEGLTAGAKPAHSASPVRRGDRQVVFVIEDDDAMRDLIVTGLQRRGHVVFCVETSAEAMEEYPLVHDTVTTLLIDIGLADMDGFTCARQLLTIDDRPGVVFMSGDEPDGDMPIAGAGFLRKPFTIKQIEEALHHVESGRQG
jgi:CheY-like chemotaxis protein